MQTIGERLEEARKRKGISVREAAEMTKIRGDYLQKFEANSFGLDLPPLYIRGFVRSYARFLELDSVRIVAELDTVLSDGKPTRRESREGYGRVDFSEPTRSPDTTEPPPKNRAAQDQAMMLKFGLLIGGGLLVVAALFFLVRVLFVDNPSKPTTGQAALASDKSAGRTFTLTAVESTRVKVAYADSSEIFLDGKYPLNRGESKTLRFTKDLIITVEKPDSIRIELNGQSVEVPVKKPMAQFKVPYE